ncbi:MAG: serine hydrolase domain-containing protein [Bacillota bacterium]
MSHLPTHLPQVDALFADWDKPDSPGAALVIIHEGQIVYRRGYGSANLEYGIPISPATVFHVASVSKQFTAAAIALLAERGSLSLDDTVQTHLPEVPDFGHPITIRHLIHHTSGLRDQWEILRLAGWRMDDVITQKQIMQIACRQRDLNFPPGSEYLYCNTGYTFLAEIVARVSGRSFRQFTQEQIFQPLGMRSTHFHDDHEEIVPHRAYSYKPDGKGGFKHSVLNYANVGATSLFTTADDLARWLLNFELPVVGTPALIQQLHQRFTLTSGETIPYAFGLNHTQYRGVPCVGHSGWDAGFKSFAGRFPEQRLGVVLLTNLVTFNPYDLAGKVAVAYLGDQVAWGPEEPPAPPAATPPTAWLELSADQLRPFAGSYYSEELDISYQITPEAGALLVTGRRREDLRFVPVEGETFREKENGMLSLTFVREGGQVTGMQVDGGRVRHLRFARVQ